MWIDCDVIQADGGTRTASITGAFVALGLALGKLVEAGTLKAVPLRDFVAAISVGVVDGEVLLDLCYEEDSRADVDMNFVMTAGRKMVEVQATAEHRVFDDQQLSQMLSLARKGVDELIEKQQAVLGYSHVKTIIDRDAPTISSCRATKSYALPREGALRENVFSICSK